MKKTILALAIFSAATPALADNTISNVSYTKFDSATTEVHFNRPDNWNGAGSCVIQIREANYPNTVFYQEVARNEAGSPFDHSQWADFNIHPELRPIEKQYRILCDTAAGQVQKVVPLPAPPKVTQNLTAEINSDGYSFTISGNIYVEGYAPRTRCYEVEQSTLHGNSLFADEFATYNNFHAASIPTSGVVSNIHYGYGQTRFACIGEGGTSLYLLEYQTNLQGGVTFGLEALTHY